MPLWHLHAHGAGSSRHDASVSLGSAVELGRLDRTFDVSVSASLSAVGYTVGRQHVDSILQALINEWFQLHLLSKV